MTTPTIATCKELSESGTNFEFPPRARAETGGQILQLEAKFIQPHRPGFLDIDDVVESLTQKHNLSSEMAAARREFAQANFSLDAMAVSRLRGLAGLSQAELARRTGIAQPHISRIENGMVDPSTDTIAQLANAMNVTADELFHAVRTVRQSKAGAHDDQ